jgi:hypothetical protein
VRPDEAQAGYERTRTAVVAANGGSPLISLAGLVPEPPDLAPWSQISAAVAASANPVGFLLDLFAEQLLCGLRGDTAPEAGIQLAGFLSTAEQAMDTWLLLPVAGLWIESNGAARAAVQQLRSALELWSGRTGVELSVADIRAPPADAGGVYTYYGRVPRHSTFGDAPVDFFLPAAHKALLKGAVRSAATSSRPRPAAGGGDRAEPAAADVAVTLRRLPGQVYRLEPDPFGPWIEVVEPTDLVDQLHGEQSGQDRWTPVAARVADPPHELPHPAPDFPRFASPGVLLLSRRAADTLGDLLEPHGEFLPLEGVPYLLFHVTRMLDALDEERSRLVRLAMFEGRPATVAQVSRFALHAEVVTGATVFRMTAIPRGGIFVTDRFVERGRTAALTGLRLQPVWPVAGPVALP